MYIIIVIAAPPVPGNEGLVGEGSISVAVYRRIDRRLTWLKISPWARNKNIGDVGAVSDICTYINKTTNRTYNLLKIYICL